MRHCVIPYCSCVFEHIYWLLHIWTWVRRGECVVPRDNEKQWNKTNCQCKQNETLNTVPLRILQIIQEPLHWFTSVKYRLSPNLKYTSIDFPSKNLFLIPICCVPRPTALVVRTEYFLNLHQGFPWFCSSHARFRTAVEYFDRYLNSFITSGKWTIAFSRHIR